MRAHFLTANKVYMYKQIHEKWIYKLKIQCYRNLIKSIFRTNIISKYFENLQRTEQ